MTEITTVGVDLAKSVFQVFEREMIDPGDRSWRRTA